LAYLGIFYLVTLAILDGLRAYRIQLRTETPLVMPVKFYSQMDRTPLHYAYLFMPEKDIIEQLVKAGGLKERHDPVIILH
jgi:hypothetical protein